MKTLTAIGNRLSEAAFWKRFLTSKFWHRLWLCLTYWRIKGHNEVKGAQLIVAQCPGETRRAKLSRANEALALLLKHLRLKENLEILAQREVSDILRREGVNVQAPFSTEHVVVLMRRGMYLDTNDVAKIHAHLCHGWQTTNIFAVSWSELHLIRMIWAMEDEGLTVAGSESTGIWDSDSYQWYCRGPIRFFLRELVGRFWLLFLGKI